MKDDGDERFFAAEARLNQRLGPGDEASEAVWQGGQRAAGLASCPPELVRMTVVDLFDPPLPLSERTIDSQLRPPGMDPAAMKQRRVEAGILLRFAMEVYHLKLNCGYHLLHEQPQGAGARQIVQILRLRKGPRVHVESRGCSQDSTILEFNVRGSGTAW